MKGASKRYKNPMTKYARRLDTSFMIAPKFKCKILCPENLLSIITPLHTGICSQISRVIQYGMPSFAS